ncbi:MAG: histidine triad nucleotide-binding protein [Spirochaetota bacterium]
MSTYQDNCLFCRIASKNAQASIVYEDDQIVAFEDINPQAPVHILLLPRKHISGVMGLDREDAGLIGKIYLAAKDLAEDRNIGKGFRVVVNNGRGAGQSVDHIHFHLLGGRLFSWPPG